MSLTTDVKNTVEKEREERGIHKHNNANSKKKFLAKGRREKFTFHRGLREHFLIISNLLSLRYTLPILKIIN